MASGHLLHRAVTLTVEPKFPFSGYLSSNMTATVKRAHSKKRQAISGVYWVGWVQPSLPSTSTTWAWAFKTIETCRRSGRFSATFGQLGPWVWFSLRVYPFEQRHAHKNVPFSNCLIHSRGACPQPPRLGCFTFAAPTERSSAYCSLMFLSCFPHVFLVFPSCFPVFPSCFPHVSLVLPPCFPRVLLVAPVSYWSMISCQHCMTARLLPFIEVAAKPGHSQWSFSQQCGRQVS